MPEWVGPVLGQMLSGLATTLELSAIAIPVSVVLGLALGVLATLRVPFIRLLIGLYVELWRGLPVIVTLFFLFFGLPAIGIRLTPIVASVVAMVLWGSANLAVLVRGAVDSIPRGQDEAAAALGFTWVKRMRYVIVPQALRRLIPPAIGVIVIVIQISTIATLVGVEDFLGVGRMSTERLMLSTGESHAIPILGSILIVFAIISNTLTIFANWLERRLEI